MLKAKVEADFRVTIPEALRAQIHIGDEVFVAVPSQGQITLVAKSRVEAILEATAGMWRGRTDQPAEGVDYVNALRQGGRLRDLGVVNDGD